MKTKKIKKKILIPIIGIGLSVALIAGANATYLEPGSEVDPLVTLSFVEQRISQVKYYVNEKVEEVIQSVNGNSLEIEGIKQENTELKSQIEELQNNESSTTSNLEVVEITEGQKLICGSGTQIILRGGKGEAITSELGGLADVTAGIDIKLGEAIPSNHLLIIPRDDGRGVHALTNAIFMVRGDYEIK